MKISFLLAILGFSGLFCFSPTVAKATEFEISQAESPTQSDTPDGSVESNKGATPETAIPSDPPLRPGTASAPTPSIHTGDDVNRTVADEQYREQSAIDQERARQQAVAEAEEAQRQADEQAELARQQAAEAEAEEARRQADEQAELARQQAAEAEFDLIAQATPIAPPPSTTETQSPATEVQPPVKKLELEEITFQCSDSNNLPATIAKIKDKDELLVVLWASDFFNAAGYDAQTRCNQVSARFEAYKEDELLTYITTGKLNGQPVVCLTSKDNGDCGEGVSLHNGLLFTLKSTDNSEEVLEKLATALQGEGSPEQKTLEQ